MCLIRNLADFKKTDLFIIESFVTLIFSFNKTLWFSKFLALAPNFGDLLVFSCFGNCVIVPRLLVLLLGKLSALETLSSSIVPSVFFRIINLNK